MTTYDLIIFLAFAAIILGSVWVGISVWIYSPDKIVINIIVSLFSFAFAWNLFEAVKKDMN